MSALPAAGHFRRDRERVPMHDSQKTSPRRAELLAPAGSFDSMKAAIAAGADAVYIGGSRFGARAYADNPGEEQLLSAIDYAHFYGIPLYLTVNTLVKEQEFNSLYEYLEPYCARGLDAVIVQDMGVLAAVRKWFPALRVHASTQMTVTGVNGAALLKEMGVSRVVAARELSLKELRRIHEEVDIQIESFVHGALCYCYSGQCLLSSLIGGRSGNRGRCAQPCRLPYEVLKDGRTLTQKDRRYVMSLKDLCTLDILPDILESGVCSLKIEGRMKSPRYTAGVVSVYRKYLDRYIKNGPGGYYVEETDKRLLSDLFDRGGYTTGYYGQHNGKDMVVLKEKPSFRRTDQALLDRIDAEYIRTGKKRRIGGRLSAKTGEPLRLLLWTEDGTVAAQVEGAVVRKARKQPMTAECLERQVRKTGGTPFVFDRLETEADEDGFVQVRELNELRRKGLAALREAILRSYARSLPDGGPSPCDESSGLPDGDPGPCDGSSGLPDGDPDPCDGSSGLPDGSPGPCDESPVLPDGSPGPCDESPGLPDGSPGPYDESPVLPGGGSNPGGGSSGSSDGIINLHVGSPDLPDGSPGPCGKSSGLPDGNFTPHGGAVSLSAARKRTPGAPALHVLVSCRPQFEAALEEADVAEIQIESDRFPPERWAFLASACHEARKRCVLALPVIWRGEAENYFEKNGKRLAEAVFDGFLVRNLEEIRVFTRFREQCAAARPLSPDKGPAGRVPRIFADHHLYVFNREAALSLTRLGAERLTFPLELNGREIGELADSLSDTEDRPSFELTAYGFLPVMVTAQCVRKTVSACGREPELLYLRDRTGKKLPVYNHCVFCYNTIYNPDPLSLLGMETVVARIAPSALRLQFFTETRGETAAVIRAFADSFLHPGRAADGGDAALGAREYTRGHLKRGVL